MELSIESSSDMPGGPYTTVELLSFPKASIANARGAALTALKRQPGEQIAITSSQPPSLDHLPPTFMHMSLSNFVRFMQRGQLDGHGLQLRRAGGDRAGSNCTLQPQQTHMQASRRLFRSALCRAAALLAKPRVGQSGVK